jgi:hypothetical protein
MRITKVFFRTAAFVLLPLLCLISACSSTANPATPTTAASPSPAEALAVFVPSTPTALPTQPSVNTSAAGPASARTEVSGVAQDVSVQVIEAAGSGSNRAWWEVMPQYSVQTLVGYQVTNHSREPQIFVFPVQGLNVNEAAAKAAGALYTLLQDQQAGEQMPFLPLSSGRQMMNAQVKYLDFQNGRGVRYLTQYANGIAPVNNNELFYTYQGLTGDGRYYLAVVLPIHLNGLPNYPNETENLPIEFTSDYFAYLTSIVHQLNLEPESIYSPDLSKLDAFVGSIEVK